MIHVGLAIKGVITSCKKWSEVAEVRKRKKVVYPLAISEQEENVSPGRTRVIEQRLSYAFTSRNVNYELMICVTWRNVVSST